MLPMAEQPVPVCAGALTVRTAAASVVISAHLGPFQRASSPQRSLSTFFCNPVPETRKIIFLFLFSIQNHGSCCLIFRGR